MQPETCTEAANIPVVIAVALHPHTETDVDQRLPATASAAAADLLPQSGVFPGAHRTDAYPHAPSASGVIPTRFPHAPPRTFGMERRRRTAGGHRTTPSSPPKTALGSASTSTERWVANPKSTPTSALAAETRTTELKNALELRRIRPLTPYHVREWESLITQLDLVPRYPFLIVGLASGFMVGIPPISLTFTPPNNTSLAENRDAFESIINTEFRRGRYIGPFTREMLEAIIGPFQTSPLSLVPKPHKSTFRLIQNLSFPHVQLQDPSISSINSAINSNDFPCTWGTFHTICVLIHMLPPGSEAAIRDVSEAYRTCAIHESQWAGAVVKLADADSYAVDTCLAFGLSSSAGVYGCVADAAADIFRRRGMGPLEKWVDDHFFVRIRREHINDFNLLRAAKASSIAGNGGRCQVDGRVVFHGGIWPSERVEEFSEDLAYPIQDLSASSPRSAHDVQFTYCFADIDRLSSQMGVPWDTSKDHPFSHQVPFTGLVWNLRDLVVSLPDKKREKYLLAITEWESKQTHNLEEFKSIYGKLLHTCSVFPAGRAYLTSLESMLPSCSSHPFLPHTPAKGTSLDIQWFRRRLEQPGLTRQIPGPWEIKDLLAFSDASSGTGIAIWINGWWRAWRLIPGWNKQGREIMWAESIGFEFLVIAALRILGDDKCKAFKVFGDNRGVVEGWWSGRSRHKPTNTVFRRIHKLVEASSKDVFTR